jgi:hypothetical protein
MQLSRNIFLSLHPEAMIDRELDASGTDFPSLFRAHALQSSELYGNSTVLGLVVLQYVLL